MLDRSSPTQTFAAYNLLSSRSVTSWNEDPGCVCPVIYIWRRNQRSMPRQLRTDGQHYSVTSQTQEKHFKNTLTPICSL